MKKDRSALSITFRVISILLHPLLMPVWLILILLGGDLLPLIISSEIKRYIYGLVFINTLLMPFLSIALMRMLRIIDRPTIGGSDFIFPLTIVALCYLMCGWMFSGLAVLVLLRRIMFSAAACALMAMVVGCYKRASLHMIGIGGAVGLIFAMMCGGLVNLVWLLCGAIIASGVLASARGFRNRESQMQLISGFSSGFFVAALSFLFLGFL